MLRILWDLHQHVATCYTVYSKNRACLSLLLKHGRRVGGGGLLNRSLAIKALPQVVGNLSQLLLWPEGTQTHLPESFLNSVSICSLQCRYWPYCGIKENWKWTRLETKNKKVLPRSTVTSLSKGHFNQNAFAVHKAGTWLQNFLFPVIRGKQRLSISASETTPVRKKGE